MFIYVLFLFYTYRLQEFLFNLFLDFQKHSTIDIELYDICYMLLCECTIMKIQHKQQQGKDL